MQTKQIVQASANVIRITNIQKGNIYKRFDESGDYTYYGIVTEVLNDGNNAIISATEYRKSYSSMNVENKVIRGDKEYVIFPATLDDFQIEFQSVIDSKEKEIENSRKSISEAEKTIETTRKLLSGELQKELSVPMFKEMPQVDFDQKLREIAS